MGGLVEAQVARAVQALATFSGDIASEVIENDARVNADEVAIDGACQPSSSGASRRRATCA